MAMLIEQGLIAGSDPWTFFGEVLCAGTHQGAVGLLLDGRVDVAVVYRVAAAFLSITERTHPGLLKDLYGVSGFSTAQDSEYDALRAFVASLGISE